jgi:hypothetical protein
MTESASSAPTQVNFALWATQGGGLARWDDAQGCDVWHEAPSQFPEFKVGEPIPRQWDLIPANDAARAEIREGGGDFPGPILDI